MISVDTKEKQLVGNFKNGGREWQPKGVPELVDVHDFPSDAVDGAEPLGRDLLAGRVLPAIELRSDDEAATIRRIRDQVNDNQCSGYS